MNRPPLMLYVKDGCHLCDEAGGLLRRLRVAFEAVDIAGDATLRERYGLRIPVLVRGQAELDWPFGPPDVTSLLERERTK